jgi:hypothetical protein
MVGDSGYTISDLIEKEQEGGCQLGPFHRQWLIERAPERIRRNLELAQRFPNLVGAQSQYTATVGNSAANPTSFTAVTASATETNLWVPAIWTPIPANDMTAGKIYKVSFGGAFTSTATQGVLTWTMRAGVSTTPATNVSLGLSNLTAPAASLTSAPFFGEFTMVVRTLGLAAAGATVTGNGFVVTQGAAAATAITYTMGALLPATIDNTATSGMIMSLTISVASQSYTCQWVSPVRSYN